VRLRDCTGNAGWPRQDVCFFYQEGEARADGSGRVVRVGPRADRPEHDRAVGPPQAARGLRF